MTNTMNFTSRDLEVLPDVDNKRYEIIEGELYMSKQPHWNHQNVCGNIFLLLQTWSRQTKTGRASLAPGIIFADDDDVAPDLVWISNARLAKALREDGKLHNAPDLVIEVLSPGVANERRDRETKLKLYSRRGVLEYWIVDWPLGQVQVYQRDKASLHLQATLSEGDILESPLLPGFSCSLTEIFEDV